MKRREWGLALQQDPTSLHFSFTPLNSTRVDQLIKDIRESLVELSKSKETFKDSVEVQLYGACAQIPDTNTKGEIFKEILSCFTDI